MNVLLTLLMVSQPLQYVLRHTIMRWPWSWFWTSLYSAWWNVNQPHTKN